MADLGLALGLLDDTKIRWKGGGTSGGGGGDKIGISSAKMSKIVPQVNRFLQSTAAKRAKQSSDHDAVLSLRDLGHRLYVGVARVNGQWRKFTLAYDKGVVSNITVDSKPCQSVVT